jgi:urease subunit beta
MIPGELILDEGSHALNPGRRITLVVKNASDRPIQVGSHYPSPKPMPAWISTAPPGMRLNIASGMAVRFEPGQQRTVELVEIGGDRQIYGFAVWSRVHCPQMPGTDRSC